MVGTDLELSLKNWHERSNEGRRGGIFRCTKCVEQNFPPSGFCRLKLNRSFSDWNSYENLAKIFFAFKIKIATRPHFLRLCVSAIPGTNGIQGARTRDPPFLQPPQLASFAPDMQPPQVVTVMTTPALATAPPALDWNYPAFKHMQICSYICSTSPPHAFFSNLIEASSDQDARWSSLR